MLRPMFSSMLRRFARVQFCGHAQRFYTVSLLKFGNYYFTRATPFVPEPSFAALAEVDNFSHEARINVGAAKEALRAMFYSLMIMGSNRSDTKTTSFRACCT